MNDLVAKSKLGQITGQTPQVIDNNTYYQIAWTTDQQPSVTKFLDDSINKFTSDGTPSDIQIDFLPVVLPVALKKIAPFAIAYGAVAFILGMIISRR